MRGGKKDRHQRRGRKPDRAQRGGSLQFEALRQEILRTETTTAAVSAGGGRPRAVVLYPGPYEEGMASLSVHVLVELFSQAGWEIERAFDFPGFSGPVRTIETGTPIGDADVLLVTVPFELQILTLVRLLAASGIPPRADARPDGRPLVVCGGPAPTGNPLPWAAIADFVYLGELEAQHPRLAAALAAIVDDRTVHTDSTPPMAGLVNCRALRSGETSRPAARQASDDVDRFVPRSIYVVRGGPFGGRALVEVARGCPHGCRFCLARAIYAPHRPRSREAISRALAELAETGAADVGFIAPSFANHPQATELVHEARRLGLTVSAPSLRADAVARRPELLQALREGGQETLTIAPEAATERLRRHIGKPLRDDVLLDVAAMAAEIGFTQLKLYFMVGLPSEGPEDIAAFAGLFDRLAEAAAGPTKISLSVACFVPKPQTAFQNEEMLNVAELRRRLATVERSGRQAGIEVSAESPRLAWAQAAIARGDLRLGQALAEVALDGIGPTRLLAALERAGVNALQIATKGALDAPWTKVVCGPHL